METDYFDRAAATWDDVPRRIALMKAVGAAILRESPPAKDMDVLDYGCGERAFPVFLIVARLACSGAFSDHP